MTKDPLKRLNKLIHGEEGALRFRELGEMADDLADEIERLRARVKELEASQKPRPMSEAPKDGKFLGLTWGSWHIAYPGPRPDTWFVTTADGDTIRSGRQMDGCLPLPQEEKK